MNFRQIDLFFILVKHKSFTKAEDEAFLTKQALKKQIDALEEELGFTLFVRSNQGLELTRQGRMFYEGMRRIHSDIDSLIHNCREETNAEYIRIGIPDYPKLFLEDRMYLFARKHPEIKQIIITYDPSHLVSMLKESQIDIADVIYSSIYDDPELEFKKLSSSGFFCLVHQDHPLASRSSLSPDDLRGYNVFMQERGNDALRAFLNSKYPDISLNLVCGLETHTIISVCCNGDIFLSKSLFIENMNSLVAIPLDIDLDVQYGILYAKNHAGVVDTFIKDAAVSVPENLC